MLAKKERVPYDEGAPEEGRQKNEKGRDDTLIGKNVARFRKELGMTQDELAEKLQVSRQTVSSWERERTQPDLETLKRLAEALHVTLEDVIYGKAPAKNVTIEKSVGSGIDMMTAVGASLAVVLSYLKWHSIGWAIIHGLLNWVYVIYYVIRY